MAYASCLGGIVASNNLRDVKHYCDERKIQVLTTADVLVRVHEERSLSMDEADSIWRRMVQKRSRLPAASLSEYLASIRT